MGRISGTHSNRRSKWNRRRAQFAFLRRAAEVCCTTTFFSVPAQPHAWRAAYLAQAALVRDEQASSHSRPTHLTLRGSARLETLTWNFSLSVEGVTVYCDPPFRYLARNAMTAV